MASYELSTQYEEGVGKHNKPFGAMFHVTSTNTGDKQENLQMKKINFTKIPKNAHKTLNKKYQVPQQLQMTIRTGLINQK